MIVLIWLVCRLDFVGTGCRLPRDDFSRPCLNKRTIPSLIRKLRNKLTQLSVTGIDVKLHQPGTKIGKPAEISRAAFRSLTECESEAWLGRKRCQLKIMGPARFVLGMKIVERLGDLYRIHYDVRSLLSNRQRPSSG